MELTITEALSEIKLTQAKIGKKREFVLEYLTRPSSRVDPLSESGGTTQMIAQQLQSIRDLQERVIGLRNAINRANNDNMISLNSVKRTIADWLVWKRDVWPGEANFWAKIGKDISNARYAMDYDGVRPHKTGATTPDDLIVHIDEAEMMKIVEQLQDTENRLDGLLSLKNAQIMVEVE